MSQTHPQHQCVQWQVPIILKLSTGHTGLGYQLHAGQGMASLHKQPAEDIIIKEHGVTQTMEHNIFCIKARVFNL